MLSSMFFLGSQLKQATNLSAEEFAKTTRVLFFKK